MTGYCEERKTLVPLWGLELIQMCVYFSRLYSW